MTRQRPQSAEAPEAKPLLMVGVPANVRTISSAEEARRLYGWNLSLAIFDSVVTFTMLSPDAKYGRGTPPGEGFTLTEEQVAEWRGDARKERK